MAIKPIYWEEHPITKDVLWGLAPKDFYKVMQGYGCPKCLEDFNGVYLATCPVCGHKRNPVNDWRSTPDHFLPGEEAPAPEPEL